MNPVNVESRDLDLGVLTNRHVASGGNTVQSLNPGLLIISGFMVPHPDQDGT